MTPATRLAYDLALEEAVRLDAAALDLEHVFIALCKADTLHRRRPDAVLGIGDAERESAREEAKAFVAALETSEVDRVQSRRIVRELWRRAHPEREKFGGHRSPRCREAFARAGALAAGPTTLMALMRALLERPSLLIVQALEAQHLGPSELAEALAGGFKARRADPPAADAPPPAPQKDAPPAPRRDGKDVVGRYGRDLTRLAREGKLAPVVGRKDDIKRIARVLMQARRGNPLLVGPAGVGKTALVEGLAQRLVAEGAPAALAGLRIVELSMGALVADATYRGEFEERMQAVLRQAEGDPRLLLFIDEIHTIIGAGAIRGAMDAANLLKPALARGTFRCIGATTTEEYRKHIEKDPALERRFQTVWIEEPTRAEALEMLEGVRPGLETHHGVAIEKAALERAVDLSIRYLPHLRLPDKAIEVVDQACARARFTTFSSPGPATARPGVGPDEIAAVVADRCRVPIERLTRDDAQRLLDLETLLERRVKGQPAAVKAVADAIRSARAGLRDERRPVGVFLFLGPTGTGKTEMARALAEVLFDDETRMIRIDMSEYGEKHSVARLIGAPPGFVGHDEGGQLTDAIRSQPYSVVLFDEVEKAHPSVFDVFLQIFDDGRLTDGRGRTASFAEAVIIMTSNLGTAGEAEEAKGGIGFNPVEDLTRPVIRTDAVAAAFRPELRNRIQKEVVFQPLGPEVLGQVLEKQLERLRARLAEKRIRLELDEAARAILLKEGYNPRMGARPLERTVQRLIQEPLARMILAGEAPEGALVRAKGEAGEIRLQAVTTPSSGR